MNETKWYQMKWHYNKTFNDYTYNDSTLIELEGTALPIYMTVLKGIRCDKHPSLIDKRQKFMFSL